jgi:hypothetical protein
VEETSERWVKVVAVDRSGNKSNPSDASSATALLIDDAHISDLTVSKVTAGEITADWVLAAAIKTAASGQRLELNAAGLQSYDTEGSQTINLASDPDANGNFITFQQDGVSLASIDSSGNLSGQNVSVANDLSIDGRDFQTELYDPLPKGLVAWGPVNAGGVSTTTEIGLHELSFDAVDGRSYRFEVHPFLVEGTTDAQTIGLRIRDGGSDTPDVTSTVVGYGYQKFAGTSSYTTLHWSRVMRCGSGMELTPGVHRFLTCLYASGGTATVYNNAANYVYASVEDVGPNVADTGYANNGGGATTPVVKTYTKTYTATWSGSYDSGNAYITYWGNSANQGDAPPASYGNQRGLIGFNAAQIQSDLAGATITSVKITLYANHWYYNAGGTARLGTHNYTSRPTTWTDSRVNQNRWTSTSWPKPGKRTVTLPNSVGDEFKAGTSTGISTGPGTSSYTDYGRFAGAGSGSNTPVLEIVYTK